MLSLTPDPFWRVLPCSTILEENSSLRVNWEQLESGDERRGSELGVWSEPFLVPPIGSIPTNGRKPTSSPRSMDAHTGSRSILRCDGAQTVSMTSTFETPSRRLAGWDEINQELRPRFRRSGWERAFQVQSSRIESILKTACAAKLISFCVFSPWCWSRMEVSGTARAGI